MEVISLQYGDWDSAGLLVRSEIATPKDLVGRTIAVPGGSTAHYQFLYFLDLTGLTGDVNVRLEQPSAFEDLWRRGDIDGVHIWGMRMC